MAAKGQLVVWDSPSRMTVTGLGRKPSPSGHKVLYSAARERAVVRGERRAYGQGLG